MGVCLEPVHETGTLALSQAAHPVPSIHSHFFASCQLKVIAPKSYLLVEHMKIMVVFAVLIYLIHLYGSLIEALHLNFPFMYWLHFCHPEK